MGVGNGCCVGDVLRGASASPFPLGPRRWRRRLTALEEPGGLAHGRLDVEDLDVLPVLLEERDEEVDGELHVVDELLLGHGAVAHSHVQAQHLLQLELDHGLHLVHLGREVLRREHDGGELARLVQAGAEQTRDLLDQRLRGEEDLVLLGELLDELLVLVEGLQSVGVLEVQAQAGGLLAVEGVTEDADAELGAGDVRQLDGAGETLVLLGIVVLEADLELDRLGELTGLLLGLGEDVRDAVADLVGGELAVGSRENEMGGVRSVECRQRRSVQAS